MISKLVNASTADNANLKFSLGDGQLHPELEFLAKLNETYSAVTPELLTPYGEQDAHSSGYRFGNRYGHLLGKKDWYNAPVNQSLPVFARTTDQSRVNVTSWAFSEGFLGLNWRERLAAPLLTLPDSLSTYNDSLAVGTCPYSANDTSSDKAFAAWNSVYLPKVVSRLQRALPNLNLTTSDVQAMQNACPFQSAYLGRLSPFCAIFTLREWELYSYGQDLQQYENAGYGGPLVGLGALGGSTSCLRDSPRRASKTTRRPTPLWTKALRPSHSVFPFTWTLPTTRRSRPPSQSWPAQRSDQPFQLSQGRSTMEFGPYRADGGSYHRRATEMREQEEQVRPRAAQ